MSLIKKLFGNIEKIEDLDDGTIKVSGYASSGAKDSDGETVLPEAMKNALPDYMAYANIREMHQAKAAGTAIEAKVEDDGRTFIRAHIVDSEAVKKVKAKVYKGFSIGGKVTARDETDKTIIKGLRLAEISLVDRPANPEAVMTCWKAEKTTDEVAVDDLAKLLDEGGSDMAQALIKHGKDIIAKKAAPVEEPKKDDKPPVKEPAAAVDKAKKGMYTVSELARCLESLSYIAAGCASEAEYEGDNSPVPAKLRTAMKVVGEALKEMTVEEVSELLAAAKVSKAAKVEVNGDVSKLEAQVQTLGEQLTKAVSDITALKAQPMPTASVTRVVEKATEATPGSDTLKMEIAPILNPDGSVDVAASLVKAAHKYGARSPNPAGASG